MKRVNRQRWQQAQAAESSYWQFASRDVSELLRITREKVAAMQWALQVVDGLVTQEGSLVEVGIGPMGVGCIHFLPDPMTHDRLLIGIDPLPGEEAYQTALLSMPKALRAMIQACHSEQFRLLVGMGENMGLPSNSAAFVACYNVLDHCLDPRMVLSEIRRILQPGGRVLLGCDVYSFAGLVKHRLRAVGMRTLGIKPTAIGDVAHPFQFLAWDLEHLVSVAGFEILAISRRPCERLPRLWGHAHRMLIVAHKPQYVDEVTASAI